MILPVLLAGTALAAPPLVMVADVAAEGLRVWWRPGDLVVATHPAEGGEVLRPLAHPPGSPPASLRRGGAGPLGPDWTELGLACDAREGDFDLDGRTLRVTARGPWTRPVIAVHDGDTLLAEAALGRPAQVCAVIAGQADATPEPEIVVFWRVGPDEEAPRGVSVFRLPETAR